MPDLASRPTGSEEAMALVRCEQRGCPRGRTYKYVRAVLLVGHPNGGLVCGSEGRGRPGLIWLDLRGAEAEFIGRSVFALQSDPPKVRAQ